MTIFAKKAILCILLQEDLQIYIYKRRQPVYWITARRFVRKGTTDMGDFITLSNLKLFYNLESEVRCKDSQFLSNNLHVWDIFYFTAPTLFLPNTLVTSCRRLYDARHRRNRFRGGGNLLRKGNLCRYVGMAYFILLYYP